jgi:hypothetical protein
MNKNNDRASGIPSSFTAWLRDMGRRGPAGAWSRRDAFKAQREAEQRAEMARLLDHSAARIAGELTRTIAEETHRNMAHAHAHLVEHLSQETGRQMAHLGQHASQETGRQMAHLDQHMSQEIGRQMAHLEERYTQALIRQAAALETRLTLELGRQIASVDEHLSGQMPRDTDSAMDALRASLTETLVEHQTTFRRDLHGHMSHVDAHLSEHLSKQLTLHLGRGCASAHRSEPAVLQQRLLALGRLLRPVKAEGFAKVRVGHAADGGYVLLDDFAKVGFALSFGVGEEITWDLAMAGRGIDIHQFDHTVEKPPSTHPRVHFHRKKIVAVQQGEDESLQSAQRLGGDALCIVKMDIEGDEWNVLEAATAEDFTKVTQFVCEFHDFDKVDDAGWYERAEAVLTALAGHFRVVHVHANNYGALHRLGNVAFPEILEVTFANTAFYSFHDTDEVFPGPLDAPNRPDLPDIVLGAFRF